MSPITKKPFSRDGLREGNVCISPKVLVVEDDSVMQYMAQTTLEILGCEVVVASTAKQAFEAFDDSFDCIFLDIGLPDGNGFDVCKRMRARHTENKVPIIACTTYDREIEQKCLQVGMNEFVKKPLNLAIIDQLLQRWIPGFALAEYA